MASVKGTSPRVRSDLDIGSGGAAVTVASAGRIADRTDGSAGEVHGGTASSLVGRPPTPASSSWSIGMSEGAAAPKLPQPSRGCWSAAPRRRAGVRRRRCRGLLARFAGEVRRFPRFDRGHGRPRVRVVPGLISGHSGRPPADPHSGYGLHGLGQQAGIVLQQTPKTDQHLPGVAVWIFVQLVLSEQPRQVFMRQHQLRDVDLLVVCDSPEHPQRRPIAGWLMVVDGAVYAAWGRSDLSSALLAIS